jgi:hypothetical protein
MAAPARVAACDLAGAAATIPPAMAASAPRRADADPPRVDSAAIERRIARQRAKRHARIEHERERRRARKRYWVLLAALLFYALFLSLTVWDQIQALFGL